MSPAPTQQESKDEGSSIAPYALDAQSLARLAELDPGGSGRLLQRVLRAYAASLDRLMGDFRQGRSAGEAPVLRQVAHTLKSSSASVGALQLAALCAELEQGLREPGGVNNNGILDRLELEAARVAVAVHAMLET